MLNEIGPEMEPCGTSAMTPCQELKLFIRTLFFYCPDNFLCSLELLYQIHKLLTWQLTICGSVCQRSLTNPKILHMYNLFYPKFFHLSSMLIKQCWVLWFLLKLVKRSDNLSFTKSSICWYITFRRPLTHGIKHWQNYNFLCLSRHSS